MFMDAPYARHARGVSTERAVHLYRPACNELSLGGRNLMKEIIVLVLKAIKIKPRFYPNPCALLFL